MENLETWWGGLTSLYKFFWATSVLSTVVFATMVVLSAVGGDADGDTDGGHLDADGGGVMSYILSTKTLVAFMLGASWTGLTAMYQGCSVFAIALISIVSGVLMMAMVAFLLSLIVRLQYNSTLRMDNTIGSTGVVYVTVQPNRKKGGQVEILVNNSYKTFDAVSDEDTPLPPEQPIIVSDLLDGNVLLVERRPATDNATTI